MQNGHAVTIDAGARFRRHPDPPHAHPLLFFGFVEQRQAASAAAERAVAAALHLHPPQARNGIEHVARVLVDAVMPAEIAGIVVGVHVPFSHGFSRIWPVLTARAITWLMCSTGGTSL